MNTVRVALFVAAALGILASPGRAQTEARMEIAVSGGLIGGAALGSTDANIRANVAGATATSVRLFTLDSEFGRTPLVGAHLSYPLTRRLAVEGGLTWSRPELRGQVTSDAEGAPPVALAEQLDQFFFDGSLLIAIPELTLGRRAVPFAMAGMGYLRQLHEGHTVIEHGEVYHVGGGFKLPLVTRPAGLVRGIGIRGEMRAYLLRRGVSFDSGPRPHLAVSGGAFIRF